VFSIKLFITTFISCAFLLASTSHAQPQVDSFTLVNADTGEELANYQTISGISSGSLAVEAANRISLKFNTSNSSSVRISGVSSKPRIENQTPFSLLGDDGNVFVPWSPEIGVYTIVVEPFSGSSASGEQGDDAALTLTITDAVAQPEPTVDDPTPINPEPPSVPSPTPQPEPQPRTATTYKMVPAVIDLLLSEDRSLVLATPPAPPTEQKQVVIIVGASIVQQAFGQDLTLTNEDVMSKLAANGVNNIDFYGYGFSGFRVGNILERIDTALEAFPDATLIVHIGGNDVTATRPYASRTQEQVDQFTLDIETLLARFSGIEDQLILIPLTYRSYAWPFDDDSIFIDGAAGSEPFNVNEYLPRIPDRHKNIDGNHILDWFNLTRNNRFSYSGSDGIHLNRTGNEALRQITADRLDFLINGGERPRVINRD